MMTSAVAKKPLRQVDSVQHLLKNEQAQQQLAAVAAKHMNPERLMRVTANAIRTTPKLQQCEPLSFLGALMQCAALGLEPNTVLGHAYLIPFDNRRKADELGIPKGSPRTAAEQHGFLVRMGRAVRIDRNDFPKLIKACRDQAKEPASTSSNTARTGTSETPGSQTGQRAAQAAKMLKKRSQPTSPQKGGKVPQMSQRT